MRKGRLLVIVDDVRTSRFICNVARRLELSCLAIRTNGDLETAYQLSDPYVILLDPKPRVAKARNVLRKLAEQHADAAIILASNNSKRIHNLERIGDSLGLNMVGALPDIFDVDTLKRELVSIFQNLGLRTANLWQGEKKC